MDLKSELLKSIWYAFTSLEAERSGKVSKSQLKVRETTVVYFWAKGSRGVGGQTNKQKTPYLCLGMRQGLSLAVYVFSHYWLHVRKLLY